MKVLLTLAMLAGALFLVVPAYSAADESTFDVAIVSLEFNSLVVPLNGMDTRYEIEIENRTGVPLSGIILHGWVRQGGTIRSAGGTLVKCGNEELGVLPPGKCVMSEGLYPSNDNAGHGFFLPGHASAIIGLRHPELSGTITTAEKELTLSCGDDIVCRSIRRSHRE